MLHALLGYVAVVCGAPLPALLFGEGRLVRSHGPAWAMAWASAGALVMLLWAFPGSGESLCLRFAGWRMPGGNLVFGLDPLSALFLLPLLAVGGACALYGPAYLRGHAAGRLHWLLFGLLLGAMVVVVIARNGVLFLLAWEVMSLASFGLVVGERPSAADLRAGWVYFVTAHVGAAALLVLFLMLEHATGSFDFAVWTNADLGRAGAGAAFLLLLTGFGAKAGFVPLHVWLPLAHPAAPSHVSALMSGVMIKMGVYGLLRMIPFLGPAQGWWALSLLALGAVTGTLGILFALGQRDLKQLLAYSSIENVGIILLGLGAGMYGVLAGEGTVAFFGYTGALLHVVNHGLFKGLLFLGAGAVIGQTGTGELDRLGGLLKRLPWTGALFLTGCAAICGLPLLNGFVSELFLYVAAITGAVRGATPAVALTGMGVTVTLAAIGALAVACFTRAFGTVFLGSARGPMSVPAREVCFSMVAAMGLLAGLCALGGLCSLCVVPLVLPAAAGLAGAGFEEDARALAFLLTLLPGVFAATVVVGMVALRAGARHRPDTVTVSTWDCGYGAPAPSMQYTAASFGRPVVTYFALPLAATTEVVQDEAVFPTGSWTVSSSVEDWVLSRVYAPILVGANRALEPLRMVQNGKLGFYVLYIALAAALLVAWEYLR